MLEFGDLQVHLLTKTVAQSPDSDTCLHTNSHFLMSHYNIHYKKLESSEEIIGTKIETEKVNLYLNHSFPIDLE